MLASKPAPVRVAASAAADRRIPGVWRAVAPVAGATGVALGWLYYGNPRLWGSWHGFLHTAIATRFAVGSFPPENPFFAGEPLPYYWLYHFVAYWLSRASGLDLLHTFHLISWMSLAALVVFAGMAGRMCFRSHRAGVAIAVLALVGVNPLGPAIALAKHWSRGIPLVEHWPEAVETTFVTNQAADELMTQPLLGAMYVGGDWRQGQNLVWFFDVGSRAAALAGLMLLLYLLLKPDPGRARLAAVTVVSAWTTAINPLVGLAVAGALAGACVLVARGPRPFALCAACLFGAVLAAPTYVQMFRAGGSGTSIHPALALTAVIVTANFLVLAPLAAAGIRSVRYRDGIGLPAVAVAGAALLLAVVLVHLPEGNEHNLSNAAACMLALPGAALIRKRAHAAVLIALFLPVTGATLASFARRPPIPIANSGQTLLRTPEDSDLARLYDWIRSETPRQSVFVVDCGAPVKMSGNVSELPAFTSRTLFTDAPSYLTTPNRDAASRDRLARAATGGERLSPDQRRYLAGLRRPVYVLTYAAGDETLIARLTEQYGAPVFRRGIVAVFQLRS
jgi:Uncharacterized membrane protein (DUF2298)